MSGEAGDAALVARLAGHRVVLCRGLLGELLMGLRPIGIDYMGAQAAWLRRLGIPVLVPQLPSAAPVLDNAAGLARLIEGEPLRVILIGHSKGGLEALAALLRPEVAARVVGFVALQSPFLGSPVADWVCGHGRLHRTSRLVLRGGGFGSGHGLLDLTVAARRGWMQTNDALIAALAARIPMTSLATVLPPGAKGAYAVTGWRLAGLGWGPNDGLVPASATVLPGARHAILIGNHRALVSRGCGQDPVAVLRRALRAVLPG